MIGYWGFILKKEVGEKDELVIKEEFKSWRWMGCYGFLFGFSLIDFKMKFGLELCL